MHLTAYCLENAVPSLDINLKNGVLVALYHKQNHGFTSCNEVRLVQNDAFRLILSRKVLVQSVFLKLFKTHLSFRMKKSCFEMLLSKF